MDYCSIVRPNSCELIYTMTRMTLIKWRCCTYTLCHCLIFSRIRSCVWSWKYKAVRSKGKCTNCRILRFISVYRIKNKWYRLIYQAIQYRWGAPIRAYMYNISSYTMKDKPNTDNNQLNDKIFCQFFITDLWANLISDNAHGADKWTLSTVSTSLYVYKNIAAIRMTDKRHNISSRRCYIVETHVYVVW